MDLLKAIVPCLIETDLTVENTPPFMRKYLGDLLKIKEIDREILSLGEDVEKLQIKTVEREKLKDGIYGNLLQDQDCNQALLDYNNYLNPSISGTHGRVGWY